MSSLKKHPPSSDHYSNPAPLPSKQGKILFGHNKKEGEGTNFSIQWTENIRKSLGIYSLIKETIAAFFRHKEITLTAFIAIIALDIVTRFTIHKMADQNGAINAIIILSAIGGTFCVTALIKMFFMRHIIELNHDMMPPGWNLCIKKFFQNILILTFILGLLKAIGLQITNTLIPVASTTSGNIESFNIVDVFFHSIMMVGMNIPGFIILTAFAFVLPASAIGNHTSLSISWHQIGSLFMSIFLFITIFMGISLFVENFIRLLLLAEKETISNSAFLLNNSVISVFNVISTLCVFAIFAWLYKILGYRDDEQYYKN